MLTLENVSFDVRDEKGEKDIIKNLSLTIDDNKFVVITGPNGGGKSTLAKLIAGIYTPSQAKFILTARILQKPPLRRERIWVSALHSSSRCGLKESRYWI